MLCRITVVTTRRVRKDKNTKKRVRLEVEIASTVNRTRGPSMATMDFTTKPPMLFPVLLFPVYGSLFTALNHRCCFLFDVLHFTVYGLRYIGQHDRRFYCFLWSCTPQTASAFTARADPWRFLIHWLAIESIPSYWPKFRMWAELTDLLPFTLK